MLTTKIVLILNLMDSKKNNEMKFEYDFKEHNGG